MPYPPRFAILLDGGFVIKKLRVQLGRFPTAEDVESECGRIMEEPELKRLQLLRIYFYDAPPADGQLKNPLDGATVNLGATAEFSRHKSLLDKLEMKPDFALRLGETVTHQWRLGSRALKNLFAKPRAIAAQDIVPNITQKGVDLRVGLDIARPSLTQSVQVIVVVTG